MSFTKRITQCMAEGVSVELFPTGERRVYHAHVEVFDAYPRTRVKEFYAPNHAEAAQIVMRMASRESNDYVIRKYAPKID